MNCGSGAFQGSCRWLLILRYRRQQRETVLETYIEADQLPGPCSVRFLPRQPLTGLERRRLERGPLAATSTSRLPPDRLDLAVAAFLLKILMSACFVRDRRGRVSPRKSKKASDFPAREPGEPSVINVTRRVEFRLLYSRQVT